MSHRTLRSGHDIASGSTKAHRVTVPCSRLRLQTGSEPLWSRALLPHVRCPQCPMCAVQPQTKTLVTVPAIMLCRGWWQRFMMAHTAGVVLGWACRAGERDPGRAMFCVHPALLRCAPLRWDWPP